MVDAQNKAVHGLRMGSKINNNIKRLRGAAPRRTNNVKGVCGTTPHGAAQSFDVVVYVYFATRAPPCSVHPP
jgi:hypothetical protein